MSRGEKDTEIDTSLKTTENVQLCNIKHKGCQRMRVHKKITLEKKIMGFDIILALSYCVIPVTDTPRNTFYCWNVTGGKFRNHLRVKGLCKASDNCDKH